MTFSYLFINTLSVHTPLSSHRTSSSICRSIPPPPTPPPRRFASICMNSSATSSNFDLRIGHGYDLHRLESGYKLKLGGIELDHDRGCVGHSDGDAVLHCITDSILGALSLPDIGQLFSDKDPKWKNADSDLFLHEACNRMHALGFEIGNIDVTVILEKPKLSPHKIQMRSNIAEICKCPLEKINLKAKTHEKVDAVGENRAVEVHAVAILHKVNKASAQEQNEEEGLVGKVAEELYGRIMERKLEGDVEGSWTAKLLGMGVKKVGQKVGEEAVEVVIEAIANERENVIKESADLYFHLNVLWAQLGIEPKDVFKELQKRQNISGIQEKQSRNQ